MKGYELRATHPMVKNWAFAKEDVTSRDLADAMAVVAEKNGVEINQFKQLFTATLRMLKETESEWAK